jgi:acyl-coenzyme A synthetase/AMP-(fatty) acid ligase
MYRTGDLARWLPDENIEFLGRADQQTKIRGIRIELEEIEAVISQDKYVDQCVVTTKQESENVTLLTAYIVQKDGFSISNLKKHLNNVLPDYMIPNIFIPLAKIPLNPSGKVDRKLLQNLKR